MQSSPPETALLSYIPNIILNITSVLIVQLIYPHKLPLTSLHSNSKWLLLLSRSFLMYNPSSECGDETHDLRVLYQQAAARRALLNDPIKYPHMLPQANGHYDTLLGGYTPHAPQAEVDETIKVAKLKKRTQWSAKDWYAFGYGHRFDKLRDEWLVEINQIDQDHINGTTPENGIKCIDRFDYRDVSYEWFVKNYEKPGKACMISGFAEQWPMNTWTLKNMVEEHLKDEDVKVGKDNAGRRIGVRFDHFAQYIATTKDDSGVYLFESQINRTPQLEKIFDAYSPPTWFNKDLLNYCHPERRPPCRWFCVGQRGSGTTIHADPLGLLAWNTVLAGRKLWIVFDEICPEKLAEGVDFFSNPKPFPNIENEAIGWYDRVWPKLKQFMIDNELCKKYNPRVLIQYPGETIFMPGGVWHYVLNLDDTLAVTQNYVNMSNFALCWREMRTERKHAAKRWLANLKVRYPLAYKLAMELDEKDSFSITFKKPIKTGRYAKIIKAIKLRKEVGETLSAEEEAKITEYDTLRAEDKVWGEEEAPFAYSPEWSKWSGSSDSSSDSDEETSSEEESSDESDSE